MHHATIPDCLFVEKLSDIKDKMKIPTDMKFCYFFLLLLSILPVAARGQVMDMFPPMQTAGSNVTGTAKAPRITVPMAMELTDTVTVNPMNVEFIWTPAMPQNVTGPVTFSYNIRIVRLMPNQVPDYAIEHNPVVYKRNSLITTSCVIPKKVVDKEFNNDAVYVVQVKAVPSSSGVVVEDNGLSPYVIFRKQDKK